MIPYYAIRSGKYAVFILVILSLTACSSDTRHDKKDAALFRMLYSPNGEPLNGGVLGQPTCQDAMSRWFERVDANHDGSISGEEFIADAQIQFYRMDLDNNNYLVSEEVERFRRPYRQEPVDTVVKPSSQEGKHQRTGGHRSEHVGNYEKTDRQEAASSDIVDPVMAADSNLDFKITADEFMAHAQKMFLDLNSAHNGLLNREETLTQCAEQ